MPVTEIPQTQCPKCGTWLDDHDGFGVLAHGKCGYCCHPSTIDGTCGICGALRDSDPNTMPLMKGDTVRYLGGKHRVIDWVDKFVKIDFKGFLKWVHRNDVVFLERTSVYKLFREMED